MEESEADLRRARWIAAACTLAVVAVVALLPVVGPALASDEAGAAAVTRRCASIRFKLPGERSTGARAVRARGTTCRMARRVAYAGRRDPFGSRYRAYGYRCRGTEERGAIFKVRYRCTKRAALVRFYVSAA